jgi:multidrug efflux system membrane fusion protein
LNDQGDLGVRVLDDGDRVLFKPVKIIEDGPQGVWVSGLPNATRLITVGHEYVAVGEQVEPVYTNELGVQVAQP